MAITRRRHLPEERVGPCDLRGDSWGWDILGRDTSCNFTESQNSSGSYAQVDAMQLSNPTISIPGPQAYHISKWSVDKLKRRIHQASGIMITKNTPCFPMVKSESRCGHRVTGKERTARFPFPRAKHHLGLFRNLTTTVHDRL